LGLGGSGGLELGPGEAPLGGLSAGSAGLGAAVLPGVKMGSEPFDDAGNAAEGVMMLDINEYHSFRECEARMNVTMLETVKSVGKADLINNCGLMSRSAGSG
jgi:hypothetical protein